MANEPSARGKSLVIRVTAIAVSVSILTIVAVNAVQGTGKLPQQLVRLGFTLALCFFLVRGRPWARWTSIVLFLVAGIGAIVGSLALLGKSLGAWWLLAMGAAYLYCVGVLVMSGSVKAFFIGSLPQLPVPSDDA